MKRFGLTAFFLAILATVVFFVGSFALFMYSPANSVASRNKDFVFVEIRKGQGPKELSQLLNSKGIVSSSQDFLWLGRLGRFWKKVKAGEYQVSPAMTPIEVFSVITSGISVVHPVTVREGQNMYEIAADIEVKGLAPKDQILTLCRSPEFIASLGGLGMKTPLPQTLEGYLFPDTYHFNKTMSAEDMLRQMVRRFLSIWGEVQEQRARAMGLTRHEAITLASMVEKETGAIQERPMIASVFHNRLKKRMRLQSDPTTIYGIWERYDGNIHKSDLLQPTPYNTYTIPGLPVGPISNPGREAIQAALFPAESEYLFFVSHNDGTHEFTRSFDEHVNAVRKFQVDPNARKGKSWRDLNKKTGGGAGRAQ